MPTCPKCRSPVDVPDDHDADTIRCGICWAEVALEPRPRDAGTMPAAERQPAPPPDPFEHVPGLPLPGMAPFEDVLRGLAIRMPHLFVAPPPPKRPPAPAQPVTIEPRQIDPPDDDLDELRRRRGVKSTPMPRESRESILATHGHEPEPDRTRGRWLLAAGAGFIVFALALAIFRFVL